MLDYLQTLHDTLSEAHPPLSKDQIATLKDLHDQLERKQELISGLDPRRDDMCLLSSAMVRKLITAPKM